MEYVRQVIEQFSLLVPGKVVKLAFCNTSWQYRTGAGVVESVVRDEKEDKTKVTLTSYVDTYDADGKHRTMKFEFSDREIRDNFTGKYDYKIIVHSGTSNTLKSVARKVNAIHKHWISDWTKEIAKRKREIADRIKWIRGEKKKMAKLSKEFKI